jgi:nitronate monooxygenase
VLEIRKLLRSIGLPEVPIVMAGGVWHLEDWKDWIGNKDLGPIAFQFGTRPLLTAESPIPETWKRKLLNLVPGDVLLQRFSPTGFYSSAVKNRFIEELVGRSDRQVSFKEQAEAGFGSFFAYGRTGNGVYMAADDRAKVAGWMAEGFTQPMRTPDGTLIFVAPDRAREIGATRRTAWAVSATASSATGRTTTTTRPGVPADPRSFCIQKTLMDISHGRGSSIDDQLMFAGHNVFRFRQDPFYANGFVPTVRQLVQRVLTGR